MNPVTGEFIPTEKRRGRPKKSAPPVSNDEGTSEDHKTLYEKILTRLEDAKHTIEKLRRKNDVLSEENIKNRELISMIHKKTSML